MLAPGFHPQLGRAESKFIEIATVIRFDVILRGAGKGFLCRVSGPAAMVKQAELPHRAKGLAFA